MNSRLAFSYDPNSNILSNGENSYAYDALSRLTSVDKHDGLIKDLDDKKQEKLSIDYNYDLLGNRDSVEQTTSWMTKKGKEKQKTKIADYTANNLNQYTQISSLKRDGDDERHGNGGKLVYDKNGNLVQDSNQKYSYDYRNRLVKVESYETDKKGKTTTNTIAEFQYDVLGRRLAKTTYNDEDEVKKIVRYAYSNQDAIEESSFGIKDGKEKLKDTKEYVYWKGIDDVLAMIVSIPSFWATAKNPGKTTTSVYFYQKDQLGSVTAITDQSGKLVEEYKYDEFGKAYVRKEKKDDWKAFRKSNTGNMRLFTGREYDKEIGLYYYRARYYSAEMGRFVSRDPIGTADNVNLYSYVGNSPVMYVDAMGREKAILSIYTNTTDWLWHSWIEIKKNDIIVTYWLWPDRGGASEPTWQWPQIFDWIQVNWPEASYDAEFRSLSTSASISLTSEQLTLVNDFIVSQINDWRRWHFYSPCSAFASDVWNEISLVKLEDRNSWWLSTPRALEESIKAYNTLWN